jgi:hypothetical protein
MMRGLDFRALECFVVVAEELHFWWTELQLNMTQPSLRARVTALEEQVGEVLLGRDRRNVGLTAAGVIFRDCASSALIHAEEAVRRARGAATGERAASCCSDSRSLRPTAECPNSCNGSAVASPTSRANSSAEARPSASRDAGRADRRALLHPPCRAGVSSCSCRRSPP